MGSETINIARMLAAASSRICGRSRSLSQTHDFVAIQSEVQALPARHGWENRIIREMRWDLNDLSRKTAFYVVVRNLDNNSLAALCGARLYDLGDEAMASFVERQYVRLHGEGDQPLHAEMMCDELHQVKGRVAYLADFKIYPSGRSLPRINPTDLMTVLYGLALQGLDPDWFCGFLTASNVRRGLGGQYLAATVPYAVRWRKAAQGRRDDDALLCMTRAQVERLFEIGEYVGFEAISGTGADGKASASETPR